MSLFLFLFLLIKRVSGGFMYLNTTVPLIKNPVRLSCSSNMATKFFLYNTNVQEKSLTTCIVDACFDEDYGRNGQIFYKFGIHLGQAYVDILSLNRTRDETVWRCLYTDDQPSQFNLTVFSIPQGLNLTQDGYLNTDLSIASAVLECTTNGCTYPPPVIQWLYRDQSMSTEYEVFRNSTPKGMLESCVLPEKVYTSKLNLDKMTTLNDNSDRTVTFACRIEYPEPARNTVASGTKTVTFAVRVTSAVIQQNNMNITNTLNVTSGETLTLTCVTGTSRPSPVINWYIGLEWKSNGTSLNFTPSNMDHDKVIYCLAYNTDPNLIVSSNKPKLYVRVRVTEAVLQQNNRNITDSLNVTLGEQATLSCLTGTSRPAPTIDWYIGSEWHGSGTNLTFIPSYMDHNEIINCQAYNIDSNQKVYSSTPKLYVIVYVSSVHLDPPENTIIFLEGTEKNLRCTTSSCRPQPVIRWFLDGNELTDLSSVRVTPNSTLFIAFSELNLTLNRVHQDKKVYCEAKVNDQVYAINSAKPGIDVWYAPDVRVNISGSTVVGSTAVLMCTPQGNPTQYTFHPWIHRVGQTEIRRLDGVNRVTFSTLSLSNISIQDMGTYSCIVDNSITGLDGQINQMGDTHMYVQGLPIIDKTQSMFVGETNTSASIEIPFYSYPSIKTVQFIRSLDSLEISNTSYVSIYFQPSNVTTMFYMKKVMIPGYVAVLHFRNVKEIDFGNYTIQLFNDHGIQSVQFEFIALAPPSMPKKFFFTQIKVGLLVFGIEKGFNGGREQKFIVEYQPFKKPEGTWSTIFKINETDLDNPFSNGTYYIKIPKIQDGQYIFRVFAENRKGNSSAIEGVHVEIKTELSTVNRDIPVGAVVGGVVGAVVLVITIIAVAFFIKRRTLKPKLGENMNEMAHGSKGPEYTNTAFRSDINTTEYEALQSDRTGATQYEALNDPESKLNQSSDISISSDPRLLTGEIFYDKLQPCDANQGHMYSSLSSPRLDDGDKIFYENTVMSK